MLKQCSKAMLITGDLVLQQRYKSLAESCDVQLYAVNNWSPNYRILYPVIVCDSEHLEQINEAFRGDVTLVLGDMESYIPYLNVVKNFIFNREDERELTLAFFKEEKEETQKGIYRKGVCFFDFENKIFEFKKERIYFTPRQIDYLYNWLILGVKEYKQRTQLYIMRKKFGNDFLQGVDVNGELKKKGEISV